MQSPIPNPISNAAPMLGEREGTGKHCNKEDSTREHLGLVLLLSHTGLGASGAGWNATHMWDINLKQTNMTNTDSWT